MAGPGAHLVDLGNEIITALRTINGNPTYNFDLSDDTEKVKKGDGFITPVVYPGVLLGKWTAVPAYGGGASLDEYENTYLIQFWAYAPCDGPTSDERIDAAVFLANDVITTIENAHQDPTYPNLRACTKVIAALEDIFGDGQDIPPGCGLAFGSIMITTNVQRGI